MSPFPVMKVTKAELYRSAIAPKEFPKDGLPEFAFAGRSNVGKSSLINAMVNRKGLARTSSTPGKTQTINFYKVNDEWYCVDLPGYGFTKAPLSVKSKWKVMVESYLASREVLKAVFLLIDSRRGVEDDDASLIEWLLFYRITPVIVFTKIDKLNKSSVKRLVHKTVEDFADIEIFTFSALKKEGKVQIVNHIARLLS